mmetsp:Transcript_1134/g.2950  ORF Transcript_1134/g.2950 Transcript_1134/m.2950 type:complete len:347 (+) Transcript_1134:173-1213(+)
MGVMTPRTRTRTRRTGTRPTTTMTTAGATRRVTARMTRRATTPRSTWAARWTTSSSRSISSSTTRYPTISTRRARCYRAQTCLTPRPSTSPSLPSCSRSRRPLARCSSREAPRNPPWRCSPASRCGRTPSAAPSSSCRARCSRSARPPCAPSSKPRSSGAAPIPARASPRISRIHSSAFSSTSASSTCRRNCFPTSTARWQRTSPGPLRTLTRLPSARSTSSTPISHSYAASAQTPTTRTKVPRAAAVATAASGLAPSRSSRRAPLAPRVSSPCVRTMSCYVRRRRSRSLSRRGCPRGDGGRRASYSRYCSPPTQCARCPPALRRSPNNRHGLARRSKTKVTYIAI